MLLRDLMWTQVVLSPLTAKWRDLKLFPCWLTPEDLVQKEFFKLSASPGFNLHNFSHIWLKSKCIYQLHVSKLHAVNACEMQPSCIVLHTNTPHRFLWEAQDIIDGFIAGQFSESGVGYKRVTGSRLGGWKGAESGLACIHSWSSALHSFPLDLKSLGGNSHPPLTDS